TKLTEEQNEQVSGGFVKQPKFPYTITCMNCESANIEEIKTEYDERMHKIVRTYKCRDCGFIFKRNLK
ncbi:MAG: hypothetical protein IKF80_09135, partial [Erysipelotrichaceae bacterium]|nr:hypothetical protein [Erysipelotrichaceae bacterium]